MEVLYFGVLFITIQAVIAGTDEVSTCQPGDTHRIAHPSECHLYYDCSMQVQPVLGLEKNVVECEYPKVFSEDTLECENFQQVDCGAHTVRVNGCDYIQNQCIGSSHCRECIIDFPECKGKPDGKNAIPHKLGTPMYAKCFKERFMGEGSCGRDLRKNARFDIKTRTCIPI